MLKGKNLTVVLSLALIILLGTYLRLTNISPLKIYPDSYQILMVAENIEKFGSVVGTLGENGYVYPPYFGWTRPLLPLLINTFDPLFFHNLEFTAQFLGGFASILVIPASFFLLLVITGSKRAGIFAALLSAISFCIVVWSGFIYSESIGVLMMILFLICFFQSLKQPPSIASKLDLISGFVLTFAVFARYEYALILFPVYFYLLFYSRGFRVRLVNILVSFFFFGGIAFALLFPVNEAVSKLIVENRMFVIFMGIAALGAAFLYIAKKNLSKINVHLKTLATNFVCLSWIFFGYLLLLFTFPNQITLFSHEFSAWSDFAKYEILSFLTFIGVALILTKSRFKPFILFSLFSILSLAPTYYKTNPTMFRYLTHLVPFMIIISSIVATVIARNGRVPRVFLIIILAAIISQTITTYQGVKSWHNGTWFKSDYSELSPKILKSKLEPSSISPNPYPLILITSLPEAYYFHTGIPTESIADEYPYVFMDDKLNDKQIIIVEDMPMRHLFPNFSQFLDDNFQEFKFNAYFVHADYHWGNLTYPEDNPVTLYKSTLQDLKNYIELGNVKPVGSR